MNTQVTILGSGTIIPSPERSCSSYLIRSGDTMLLLDCGPGTLRRLGEFGVSLRNLDAIALSHFHLDHIADLFPILMGRWLMDPEAEHHILLAGPMGLRRYVEIYGGLEGELREVTEHWLSGYSLDVRELSRVDGGPDDIRVGRLHLATHPTPHTESSICYRVTDDDGRALFYSGDTDYTEEILPLARRADLAIMECSLPEKAKVDGHLTPALAGRLAELASIRRLVLTHFYEAVLDDDVPRVVGDSYSGAVELARDLESYVLS